MNTGEIPGWSDVVAWFGYTPNFHDAEIIGIDLRRHPEPSSLRIHIWRTHDDEGDDKFLRRDRHAIVTFIFTKITGQNLSGWNHQNVVLRLGITQDPTEFKVTIATSHGLEGELASKGLRIQIEPHRAT